ncbi:ketohydroxyglutarate aldolase [Litorimonas cladophorae]|uniref:2-dehydro-3-deoxy-phosphogluconate aldolase n=1 Tax=Litorimonas cladophorae TaxID=1220491 RepID=A0A918KGN3_9PROT|nr:bifunctional 4-hydroxy-2-oxoglutarate aldolase/2-dehydro-3-deoxy-phosphogluconate aldolase [Litorimonas cladophorae]GGX62810.1 ketohydroxyglutarate aldolase [Litorimonas cladophorae]
MSDLLNQCPVIPVVAIEDPDNAVELCHALNRGGINAIEVTLRTEKAIAAIKEIKKHCPKMILGVGTILLPDDVLASEDAGADFLVSPGLSPNLKTALQKTNLLALPGTASPSEALSAYEAGFQKVKLFPAEAVGGAQLLKSIQAPMPKVMFMPTGGVRTSNMRSYLDLPNVYAVGGTWIATMDDIKNRDWASVEKKAAEAVQIASAK